MKENWLIQVYKENLQKKRDFHEKMFVKTEMSAFYGRNLINFYR